MHIRRHYTSEDPSGTATWRYWVTLYDGSLWDVEITGNHAEHWWTLNGDLRLRTQNRQTSLPTREQALEAAVKYLQEHRSRTYHAVSC